ncbi:MAG: carboxypeptidase-like regulatory domain-containing protein, partial [Paludibacter sp.]|nr:carboxypeptidase-like regulatory domain-containing protein [Paludibacter sp.]
MIPNKPHIFNALLLIFLLLSLNIFAQTQETLAVGQVLNATDKSPVPDANIYFKNTGKGTKSNDEGYFMIRTTGDETTLVFSAVGYRTKEIRLKKGQSAGMQVELKEQNVELYEVMVVPGANPALPLMRKVREARERNDYSKLTSGTFAEQNLVYLGNISRNSLKRKIFSQLTEGAIKKADSSLVMPLFMSEKKLQRQKNTVSVISEDFFSSKPENERLLLGLTNQQSAEINFYRNSLTLFNQSFVSPLASSGNAYYNYYLTDSIMQNQRKEYQINFRTKNSKNLAFNGTMKIDSASLALTYIDATLPAEANLNYVHQLRIQQKFQPNAGFFVPESEQFSSNITYEMLADSLHPKPELFIYKKTITENINISEPANENFAGSNLSAVEIDNSMAQLGNTSVVRFAKWLADVIITGYVPVGKVDIGKVQHIARLTEVEGLRLTLP